MLTRPVSDVHCRTGNTLSSIWVNWRLSESAGVIIPLEHNDFKAKSYLNALSASVSEQIPLTACSTLVSMVCGWLRQWGEPCASLLPCGYTRVLRARRRLGCSWCSSPLWQWFTLVRPSLRCGVWAQHTPLPVAWASIPGDALNRTRCVNPSNLSTSRPVSF